VTLIADDKGKTGDDSPADENLEGAIAQLLSLRDGDNALPALVRYGPRAIPALCSFLFRRDPSGIYQPRRWAVEALATLSAYDVLRDYLIAPHNATDPAERIGDEAVVNAAARALSKVRHEWVFQLLLNLARRHPPAGVIEALGEFDRPDAIPYLIDALAEDDCRMVAEAGLRHLGFAAQPALLQASLTRRPSTERESETSFRQRRSALQLLTEIGISRQQWASVRELISDRDSQIAVLACKLCPLSAHADDKNAVVRRLKELLQGANWILAMDIEHCLGNHLGEERSNNT
jgi:hypothetical protein